MKHQRCMIRILLSSMMAVTLVLVSFTNTTKPTFYGSVALAQQPQQPTQPSPPSSPSSLPVGPDAPQQPERPAPAPTNDVIPTVGAQNTPVPVDDLPPPPPPLTTDKEKSESSAFITVVALPQAGTTRQGEIATINVVITNRGAGSARNTHISVPLDASKVQVLSFVATRPETWVSQNTPDNLEIQSGPLGANNDTITATLRLLFHANIPTGEPIITQMPFIWSDDDGGGSGRSNAPEVSFVADTYALAVTPNSGAAETAFTFSSDIFAANEPVFVWYNGPDGIVSKQSALHAAEDGSLIVVFDSSELSAGGYSFVFYGFWTGFTASGLFTIE